MSMDLTAKADRPVLEPIDRTAELLMDSHLKLLEPARARSAGIALRKRTRHATRGCVRRLAERMWIGEALRQLRSIGSAHQAGIALQPGTERSGAGRRIVGDQQARHQAVDFIASQGHVAERVPDETREKQ